MELELGLALPSPHLIMEEFNLKIENKDMFSKKRDFEEAFEIKTTLALFPAKADDGDGDGNPQHKRIRDSWLNNASKGLVVGWPPVKLSRRRSGSSGDGNGAIAGECQRRRANCVKVSMEGVAIGRKVDLSLHNSYEELLRTLNQMFNKKQLDGENGVDHPYTVTYEDGDGDWLLVGDVPWKVFIESVKRLKILN